MTLQFSSETCIVEIETQCYVWSVMANQNNNDNKNIERKRKEKKGRRNIKESMKEDGE